MKAFCDRLDLTGTGVEGVERSLATACGGVVVGLCARRAKPHPDCDHMHVVTVDVGTGEGEPLQIVCGAPNIAR